jgi:hypothetical protein
VDSQIWKEILAHPETKLNPPVSVEIIYAFEQEQKIILPKSHREFLERANGGIIGWLYVRIFSIATNNALDFTENIKFLGQHVKGTIEKEVLPFAYDAGGSLFCYHLRAPVEAYNYPVLYWNHEYSEEPEDEKWLWSSYASDFNGFLHRIIEQDKSIDWTT